MRGESVPRVLSIAGSDPSGGAGIQADLATFHAFGTYGMAVITALTAQNTVGVTGIHDVPEAFVTAQLEAVFNDVRVDAAKTGMLKTAGIIEVTAAALSASFVRSLVVDPVMVATSGDRLIDEDAVSALTSKLLPLATVTTPNREEAAVLTGRPVKSVTDARAAGQAILDFGVRAVLVTGIPEGDTMIDLLVTSHEEVLFRDPALSVSESHGSGCTLSSALAACLASELSLADAVSRAKEYVWRAIRDAFPVGSGAVPLNHLLRPKEPAK